MMTAIQGKSPTVDPEVNLLGEVAMVGQERWQEIHQLVREARVPIAEIGRRLELDRKTVRRCLQQATWQPYTRPARADTLLAPHADWLRERAPQVQYSGRILFQELRQHRAYRGSYDTVKLFVQPLRAARLSAERALVRFETPPGLQSQIDWGTATLRFRHQPAVRHIFALTLGYSRRSAYIPCPNETLPQFLDAHERPSNTSAAIPTSTSTIGRARSVRAASGAASCGIPPSGPLPTTGASSRGSASPHSGLSDPP